MAMNHPRFRRYVLGAAALAAIASLANCATTDILPKRTVYVPNKANAMCVSTRDDSCDKHLFTMVSEASEKSNAVRLAFIEFDDQGYLQSDHYKDAILGEIGKLVDRPLLIVVFAHGWKHSADANDANVRDFTDALKYIAALDKRQCSDGSPDDSGCHNREVVGVYLGWRGLSSKYEPFKGLSFWERKSRAHRVGIDGATEVIAQLGAIKAESNRRQGARRSRLVLTGHSFGAAVVYSATQQLLMRDTYFPDPDGAIPPSTADLIILVNPAFEAARFHSLHLRAAKMSFSQKQRPILAIFSAKTDDATGTLFHIGRGLSTILMPHTADSEDTPAHSPRFQRQENITAVGKYDKWTTHILKGISPPQKGQKPAKTLHSLACGWLAFQYGDAETWELDATSFSRFKAPGTGHAMEDGQQRNPYMLVRVEDAVIHEHSGIWKSEFSQFLYDLIAVQAAPFNLNCQSQ